MNRQVRNCLATCLSSACFASFASNLWLFYSYFSTHPNHPIPEQGFVHASNHSDSYVYLSDAESTGMALLSILFFFGFTVAFIVSPKKYTLRPPSLARGENSWQAGNIEIDDSIPRRRHWSIFARSSFGRG
jgi:hypothetical protein